MRHNNKMYQYKCQIIKEYSREIFLFFDKTGIITDGNQTALEVLGYGDDIFQIPIYEIFKKSIKCEGRRLIIHPKLQGGTVETIAYRKNQTCFPVELKVVTVTEGNKYLGACIATDITDKKKMLRELKHMKHELKSTKQFKNEFVANITHELKTPVNGIKGLTENIMDTELKPKQLENLNIIRRCCDTMITLINNLLDFTKFENNKLVLEKRAFHFRKFINDIIAFNIFRINEKGLKLIVNVANDIPVNVIGDEIRLAQVLNNLISNAIKFTSVGQIALEVVKVGQDKNEVELFFMVMDSGIGISREDKDKLFQSFTQVDSSITRRFGGTGLGLSICKMLIKAMNGNISVDSEKDKGSTFSFSVRLGVPEEDVTAEYEKQDNLDFSEVTGYGDKDSSLEHDYLGRMLEDVNFSMLTVSNQQKPELNRDKRAQNIRLLVEKLVLCFDMENWIKAEEIAYSLKNMIPEDNSELKHRILLLLMMIRKEEHDKSVLELKELVKILEEVTGWRI